jgi:hypothetical protein
MLQQFGGCSPIVSLTVFIEVQLVFVKQVTFALAWATKGKSSQTWLSIGRDKRSGVLIVSLQ